MGGNEDDVPEDFIAAKLEKKYDLSEEQSREYIRKYHEIHKNPTN